MTDDIVTRLRAKMNNEFIVHHPHMVRVPTIYEQAADEIERLRKALQDTFIEMEQLQKECHEWESLATRNSHP